jgi:uncharacterized membrane protein YkvA (DUF1232 family)
MAAELAAQRLSFAFMPAQRAFAAGAAAYVVSPIDPIPDFIPVIGWLDDLIVATYAVRYLFRHAGYDVLRDLWLGDDGGFAILLFLAGVER